jgi:hypothetical protein
MSQLVIFNIDKACTTRPVCRCLPVKVLQQLKEIATDFCISTVHSQVGVSHVLPPECPYHNLLYLIFSVNVQPRSAVFHGSKMLKVHGSKARL